MNYDSIIFDLDGTLWDTTHIVVDAWNEALRKQPSINKVITREDLTPVMGMASKELMATLFPEISYELGQEIFNDCADIEHEILREKGGLLFDNLENTIKTLSEKIPLFIVSNCADGYIESFIYAHKMDEYIKDFECIGKTGLAKADNIKLIVERNNLKKPVYVGDTILDYQSATLAGIPFILADYGFGDVPNVPKIDNISELIDMI